MRRHSPVSALCLSILWLTACPGPSEPGEDGGTPAGAAPEITSVSPERGPLSGDTEVTVAGTHFDPGAKVWFGGIEATQVKVESRKKITARTPSTDREGSVLVVVTNPDGQTGTLTDGFSFDTDLSGSMIGTMLNPLAAEDLSGEPTIQVTLHAAVFAPDLTPGPGQGKGIVAEYGIASSLSSPPAAKDFTWEKATYLGDHDGAQAGDQQRDRYGAEVSLPGTVSPEEVKTLYFAVRFSLDGGKSWAMADEDGSANGLSGSRVPKLTIARQVMKWCRVGTSQIEQRELSLGPGQPSIDIFSQSYQAGITDKPGQGPGVKAQLGYGKQGAARETWKWIDATYQEDLGNDDVFRATLPRPAEPGVYVFAYRLTIGNGPGKFCDADGTDNGFTDDQLGKLTVTGGGSLKLDRCHLQYPYAITAKAGATTEEIYGWVKGEGVTNGDGAPTGVVAEVGYGPAAAQPQTWTQWVPATFLGNKDGNHDEFVAKLTAPTSAGSYRYGYRFSYNGGEKIYCDKDGSDVGGFDLAQAGVLDVTAALQGIQACNVQPLESSAAKSGDGVKAWARVTVPGVTDAAGQGAGIRGQVGVGNAGDNAATSASWGWQEATYLGDVGGADEYTATFNPAFTGDRAVSFRFSLDDGTTWTYCDGDPRDGYQAAQQPALQVAPHSGLSFCNLQYPYTLTSRDTAVYGQAQKVAASAALGYGKKEVDPGLGWTWVPATLNPAGGNGNAEYQATLSGAPAGTWAYAFRVLRDGQTNYCFGDVDASSNGFTAARPEGENLGVATLP